MIYTTNDDVPGVIGTLGVVFGEAGVNIANFQLGRDAPGGNAIALLYLDSPAPAAVVERLLSSGKFKQAKPLVFEV
jgi:D-3-phosphoglycerate dehydrogenase